MLANFLNAMKIYGDLIVNDENVRNAFRKLTENEKECGKEFMAAISEIVSDANKRVKEANGNKSDENECDIFGIKFNLDNGKWRISEVDKEDSYIDPKYVCHFFDLLKNGLECDDCCCGECDDCENGCDVNVCDCVKFRKFDFSNDASADDRHETENVSESETSIADELFDEIAALKPNEDEIVELIVNDVIGKVTDKRNKPYILHRRTPSAVEVSLSSDIDQNELLNDYIRESSIKRIIEKTKVASVFFAKSSVNPEAVSVYLVPKD